MSEDKIPVSNPWIAVDLDGTIMQDGHFPGFGLPLVGAKEKLQKYSDLGIKNMIFTARTAILGLDGTYQNVNKAINDIYTWCKHHNIPCDYVFPMPKPTCILAFIDDRGIRMDKERGWQGVDNIMEKFYIPKLKDWKKEILPPEIKK